MTPTETKLPKPLGQKTYTHIGHLPGSKLGDGDHTVSAALNKLLTTASRDKHDIVIVNEKLDGTNVCVARVNGQLRSLNRLGYPCESSPWLQHNWFGEWVALNASKFEWLQEGQRICGEWLAMVHGTRYDLKHDPFVAFDVIEGPWTRWPHEKLMQVAGQFGIVTAQLLHKGGPCTIDDILQLIDWEGRNGFHGAIDPVEGAVWRLERLGKVCDLAKYVRPGFEPAKFLNQPNILWNWEPGKDAA